MSYSNDIDPGNDIAIIGLSCRFPGARNKDEYWQNLRDGVSSVTYFTDEELLEAGVDRDTLENPNFVKARSVLHEPEYFDASFFNMNPREAEILDPHNRLLLECAWESFELAGYDPNRFPGQVGVFAGAEMSNYNLFNIRRAGSKLKSVNPLQVVLAVDRGYLSTRISYELNLKGPSMTVQTSCSTSLVATHVACESLLSGECDMALAGGVTVQIPHKMGYFFEEGGILTPDGVTRTFDSQAGGTLFGSGVGVVLLRRLEDALDDGDYIYAVIKGSAINNDGAAKVGFTAPSVEGQSRVIIEAQGVADIDPATITYIEAHGTATNLGDPIEVEALTQAFRQKTDKSGFCAIGSVKSNFGHLATAAGMAGLIKTVLSLQNKMIPPSLNYESSNQEIDFPNTPFYVNHELSQWQVNGHPRRAGVSAFGMGGTNAHVILEEAPERKKSEDNGDWQLLLLSARTHSALDCTTDKLLEFLKENPETPLADIAYTLQMGRKPHEHRKILACKGREDAIAALEQKDPKRIFAQFTESKERPVAFMFPGLGDHYPNMSLGLYKTLDVFRETVDECCEILKPLMNIDLREVIFPAGTDGDPDETYSKKQDLQKMMGRQEGETEKADPNAQRLNQTSFAQPAIFVIEYSLARTLMSWGLQPQALIGHSIGEYVAACVAGVFQLKDALTMVVKRAQLIDSLPGGAMLAVPMAEDKIKPFIVHDGLSLSAVNTPNLTILSGTEEAVEAVSAALLEKNIASRRVQSSHAFHSVMMEPVMEPLTDVAKGIQRNTPEIPYISNLTGGWVTAADMEDPSFWGRHTRQPVRFADGIAKVLKETNCVLVEVGPGRTLSSMGMQNPETKGDFSRFTSLVRNVNESQPDMSFLLNGLGNMWMNGVNLDWSVLHGNQRRLRIPLPTYPFERQRYWIDPEESGEPAAIAQSSSREPFYVPSWKSSLPLPASKAEPSCFLVFGFAKGFSKSLCRELENRGHRVITVLEGIAFTSRGDTFTIRSDRGDDYKELLNVLKSEGIVPAGVFHLWNTAPLEKNFKKTTDIYLSRSFFSLFFMARAKKAVEMQEDLRILVISSHVHQVLGDEAVHPERALSLGPCKVIPQEIPGVTCRNVEIVTPKTKSSQEEYLVDRVIAELVDKGPDEVIAYRGRNRWVQIYQPAELPPVVENTIPVLRRGGVYLVTEDYRGINAQLALYIARELEAKLIIVTYTKLPAPQDRDKFLEENGPNHPVSHLITTVRELEKIKADILMIRADIADQSQMDKIVRAACDRYDTIHGVILGAGMSVGEEGSGLMALMGSLASKVRSARVLPEAFKDISLDFMVLCSSLSSEVGGAGQIANTTAESFFNAFAASYYHLQDRVTASIKWDRMLDDDTLWDSFLKILNGAGSPQVVVCRRNLHQLIAKGSDEIEESVDGKDGAKSGYARPNLPTEYISPSGEVEEQLAGMWEELLGVNTVGRNDSFFRLGGHSLVALQLLNKVRETFDVDMPAEASFDANTIAEMAERIKEAKENKKTAAPGIVPVSRDGELPISFNQEVKWEDRFKYDRELINLVAHIPLKGTLDLKLLKESITALVERHEMLRTTFNNKEKGTLQIISQKPDFELTQLDWKSLDSAAGEEKLAALVDQEKAFEFDLSEKPPWRLSLIDLAGDESILLTTFHPLVLDERSVEIFNQELAVIYDALVEGKKAELEERDLHYADFSVWQRNHFDEENQKPVLSYWERQLDGVTPAGIPSAPMQKESLNLEFSEEFTGELKTFCGEAESTVFMTLLATYQAVLYHLTGQSKIWVETAMLNRNRREVEEMMGSFENSLPMGTDVNEMFRFSDLLSRVKMVVQGAFTNQSLPFNKVLKQLEMESLIQESLTGFMFIFQNEPMGSIKLNAMQMGPLKVEKTKIKPFTLELEDTGKGLQGIVHYDSNVYRSNQVEAFIRQFTNLLKTAVKNVDRSLSELWLPGEESAAWKNE